MYRIVMVLPVLVPSFIGSAMHLVKTFGILDRILEAQYQRHRDAWIADGKLAGFFWRPPCPTGDSAGFKRNRLSHQWMSTTPDWAKGDEDAMRLFQSYQRVARHRWSWFIACMFSVTVAGIAYSILSWRGIGKY
jgi:hypothetical protein